MIDLNQEAEKYTNIVWGNYKNDVFKHNDIITDKTLSDITIKDFISGANSKYVQTKIIQAQIDILNSLDTKLQSKIEILTNMQKEHIGKMKEGHLVSKKSGLRLAKEEIRRDLKELEQQLKQLEDETNNN